MDAAFAVASTIARTTYRELPQAAIDAAKMSLLDTLGNILAGSTLGQGCGEVVDLVKEAGGAPHSTILAFGGKAPCWLAALANGATSHTLDFDDVLDEGGVHPGIMTIPAALAVAERVGDVDGQAFIVAIALGEDLACRLGQACRKANQFLWIPAHLHGTFSATAAAGKLLGLSEDKLVDAFGIALAQTTGSVESGLSVGSVMRGLYAGFTSQAGVLAALMAQKGITGSKNSLEGKAGLFNAFYRGDYDRDALMSGLGEVFEGTNIGFKPWASCRQTHQFIEATLNVVVEHDIPPEEIAQIEIHASKMGLCEPLQERRRPATSMDAKFSIPYCVAVSAAKRSVELADFTPHGLSDQRVLQMAEKVTAVLDTALGGEWSTVDPGAVEVATRAGHRYFSRVDVAKGHPQHPMSVDEIVKKFRGCAQHSAKPLSQAAVDRVVELVLGLEKVRDVVEIVRLLG